MEYKVSIFSDNILKGQDKFDYDLFNQICLDYLVDITEFKISPFDLDKITLQGDKNLIVFCENRHLDNLIIKNIRNLGSKKAIIGEQVVVFDKAGVKTIFVPLEEDLHLLQKVFTKDENKKYCQFHIFGLSKEQVKNSLENLKSRITGFSYKFIYDNLLCDIVMSYDGQSSLIDDNMVMIASEFKQYLYSENDMGLSEIVIRVLKLQNKTLAIIENVTQGEIAESLLKFQGQSVLKKVSFEDFETKTNEQLCEKAEVFKKESQSDVAVVMNGQEVEGGLNFTFALAVNSEIHIYKNSFKADKTSCIKMAKNSLLFHLAKKLREKNISF